MGFADVHINRSDYFYQLGRKDERDRIIELLQDRLNTAKNTQGIVTAMQIPVDILAVEAITEALIYAIKGEQK